VVALSAAGLTGVGPDERDICTVWAIADNVPVTNIMATITTNAKGYITFLFILLVPI
jgi:hypothetical protein